ncbi:MAG TPA: hypothetical protein VMR76_03025 [Candidatus Saccharimonadia bacterium]|nr:hypothetical protein [Candidatus Saccharimonadia bacterium]
MNIPSSPEGMSPPRDIRSQVEEMLGPTRDTTARFNLARSDFPRNLLADLILSKTTHPSALNDKNRLRRVLAVDSSLVDDTVHKSLINAGLPLLPIEKVDEQPDWIKLFAIKEGLKPLALEALTDRKSSDTYIGDIEIYGTLGQLYAEAWKATGRLLLNPENPNDHPARHVAIASFSDSKDFLYLCPPYQDSPVISHAEAVDLFAFSMNALFGDLDSSGRLNNNRSVIQSIVESSIEGFKQ